MWQCGQLNSTETDGTPSRYRVDIFKNLLVRHCNGPLLNRCNVTSDDKWILDSVETSQNFTKPKLTRQLLMLVWWTVIPYNIYPPGETLTADNHIAELMKCIDSSIKATRWLKGRFLCSWQTTLNHSLQKLWNRNWMTWGTRLSAPSTFPHLAPIVYNMFHDLSHTLKERMFKFRAVQKVSCVISLSHDIRGWV